MALKYQRDRIFLKVHIGACIFRGTNNRSGGTAFGLGHLIRGSRPDG